jgi:hypothetical protein
MRVSYVALALIAAVAGAGAIHASIAATAPGSIDPLATRPGTASGMTLAPRGFGHTPGSNLHGGLGKAKLSPATSGNPIRLAAGKPSEKPSPTANTGNPSVVPLKWVGYLKGVLPAQHLQIGCTAQFIKPNVLLTAAHCIKDIFDYPNGPWIDLTQEDFVLQYQNNEGSAEFKAICASTPRDYMLPANYSSLNQEGQALARLTAIQHDFAMILVDGNSPTGEMPYLLDWKGKVDEVVRVGYAADILNGEIISQASGALFFADAIPILPQSYPHMVIQWAPITDLTEGTSGGAWIANFSTKGGANTNMLVAVTSSSLNAYPGGEAAAYLTAAEFNPLLNYVSHGCTGSGGTPLTSGGGATTPPTGSKTAPRGSNSPAQ